MIHEDLLMRDKRILQYFLGLIAAAGIIGALRANFKFVFYRAAIQDSAGRMFFLKVRTPAAGAAGRSCGIETRT
jgi:hypothetical protein